MDLAFRRGVLKRLSAAAFAVVACLCAGWSPGFPATMKITWTSNSESDLAGYRLRYGTSPGSYSTEIDTGKAVSWTVDGLDGGRPYYFAVVAYDLAGNESLPSDEVIGSIPVSLAPLPRIESVFDVASHSIYGIRGRGHVLRVTGQNFRAGSTVSLGPEILTDESLYDPSTGDLAVSIWVGATAPFGYRVAIVTNPDGAIGSRSNSLRVVNAPDINNDCLVDILDLNALARAWNQDAGDARYAPESDLDGDRYVGPEDLAIFVKFLGKTLAGCP